MEEQDLARGIRVPQGQGLRQDPGHWEPPWGWGQVGGWTGTSSHGWVSGSGAVGGRGSEVAPRWSSRASSQPCLGVSRGHRRGHALRPHQNPPECDNLAAYTVYDISVIFYWPCQVV